MRSLYYILFSTYPGIVRKHLWAAVKALWDMVCEIPFRFGLWRVKIICSSCGRKFRRNVEIESQFWSETYADAMGVTRGTNWCDKCTYGKNPPAPVNERPGPSLCRGYQPRARADDQPAIQKRYYDVLSLKPPKGGTAVEPPEEASGGYFTIGGYDAVAAL